MPERLPTAKPLIVAGTNLESGTPNTGQILQTIGGTHTYNKMSGVVGPDVSVWVGGGRLDLAVFHTATLATLSAASGKPIVFYDAAVAISGGPISASGHKVVGVLSPAVTASGTLIYGERRDFGSVFTSGLCHSTTSGQAGFSISYTPVISG